MFYSLVCCSPTELHLRMSKSVCRCITVPIDYSVSVCSTVQVKHSSPYKCYQTQADVGRNIQGFLHRQTRYEAFLEMLSLKKWEPFWLNQKYINPFICTLFFQNGLEERPNQNGQVAIVLTLDVPCEPVSCSAFGSGIKLERP